MASRGRKVSRGDSEEYSRCLSSVDAKQLRKAETATNLKNKYLLSFAIFPDNYPEGLGTQKPAAQAQKMRLWKVIAAIAQERETKSRAQRIPFGLLENICRLPRVQSKQNPLLLDLQQLGKFCCANYLARQQRESR